MKVVDVGFDDYETEDKKGKHTFTTTCQVKMVLEDDYEQRWQCEIDILPGFKCDGLSVPVIFRWFLPSWDKKNGLYNLAGAIHDGLYANCGYYAFNRSECDDIFRGLLRESGICRFKASSADWCVGKFAGGDSHWGNDSYNCKDLIKLKLFRRLD